MKTVTVTIANKPYTIAPKVITESRAWRKKLTTPLQALAAIFQDADSVKLNNPEDIKRVFDLVTGSIAAAPDMILDLVCEYAPEIASDRATIEANAYDDEIMEAFKEVLKLVYPFGTLISFIRRRG